MDYSIGECVVFGLHGVCQIVGTETDERDHSESYVLQPVSDQRCKLYVPKNNELACQKIKKILNKEEAEALLDSISSAKDVWIVSENARKETYKQMVMRGDRQELVDLIGTMYNQQALQRKVGKRLHRMDDKYFKDARKIVLGEVAYILGTTQEAVKDMVTEKLGV